MSISPEVKRAAVTVAGAAAVALAAVHLYQPAEQVIKKGLVDDPEQPAEQVIKKGLVDDPEQVGKPINANMGVDISETNENSFTYDFIIIGGGTAGSVLASRLSERSDFKVLLLEAGTSGIALQISRVPAAYGQIMRSKHDWGLHTTPQPGCNNRELFWTRAKLLGGCSSSNAMMFHYGAASDYDEWALATDEPECKEWAFDQFLKYFQKFETFYPHPDFPVDESKRGKQGPIQTGFYGHFGNMARAFISACQSIGIPFNPDFNTATGTLGVSKIMTYITSAFSRSSAEAAYLTPTVLARPNLTVATNAHVTKILFDGKRAVGVEFSRDKDAPRYRAKARKEVVLSAGAVHTPHILMNSGVGPAHELNKHSIEKNAGAVHTPHILMNSGVGPAHELNKHSIHIIQDLPGVGDHLMDHPMPLLRFRARPGESLTFLNNKINNSFTAKLRRSKAIAQYLLMKSGPLTTNVAEAACFFRSDDPKLFPGLPPLDEDSSSGPNAPDLELIPMPIAFKNHGSEPVPHGDLVSIGTVALRPTSLGKVTLRSNNPFDPPVIDPNYLSTQHDVDVLVRGMRVALRLTQEEPLRSIIDQNDQTPELDLGLLGADDATLAKEVRARVETVYHPTSTAQVRARVETVYHPTSTARIGSVVDARLRVYGVEGLRIADCSVIPTIISGHTEAPALAIGEKAADIIKSTYPATRQG
ncbi:unnamed protein product [Rhizoctonia solani]|uniref:Glucose-methanol-choline oxidoreductase N-terminal domain-containing protein n=1 Tax=Rhizoctonia solani TaxID=456999 RepID=A0A8H3CX19_9AGAM|nr:unnamed protein product [Rhizoctonia solani]